MKRFMKSVNWPRPGYASITCSTISNIAYNLIFTTKFNDSSILITIISCDYLNLNLFCFLFLFFCFALLFYLCALFCALLCCVFMFHCIMYYLLCNLIVHAWYLWTCMCYLCLYVNVLYMFLCNIYICRFKSWLRAYVILFVSCRL